MRSNAMQDSKILSNDASAASAADENAFEASVRAGLDALTEEVSTV